MTEKISVDENIVRDNIRTLGLLSDRTLEVISKLSAGNTAPVPSAAQAFNEALSDVVTATLTLAHDVENQILGYSRDLGKTAQDAMAIDAATADTLNRVEADAFSALDPANVGSVPPSSATSVGGTTKAR